MKQLYIAIIILAFCGSAKAQDNSLFFTKGIPQSTQLNASFRPVKKWYLAMPALGSVQINSGNSGFSWDDIIRSGTGAQSDSLVVDLDYAASQMQEDNLLATESSLQVIGFGFAAKKWFFTFDINHKLKAKIKYPVSLMNLRQGNWDYDNNKPINHSFSNLYVNGIDYNEIALGASRTINDRLTVGMRVKYLIGVANVHSEYFNLDMETFANGNMRLTSDASFRTNIPLDITYDENGYVDGVEVKDDIEDELLSTNNTGWGFDFGANYKFNDKLVLGAAVNDLGFIKWKGETSRLFTKGSFEYDGIDISDEITGNESDEDDFDKVLDDLEDAFRFSSDSEAYKTGLMGSFNVSLNYQPKQWLNLGVISKNYFVEDMLVPQVTAGAGLQAGRILSTSLTYSYMKNAPSNFGAGVALNLGALQIYAVSDNLSSALKPETAKYVNARLGINFVFNGKRKKVEEVVEESVE
ncbi:DUF5723 family protein [Carboxylicivirga marina]|uniref:DUF5723 family protein n=1 Tax=Carboxylicivirga marina TaxID=2800988 RepID=UPI002593468E|nr:DUF5723 family protein [uncultured Carboxylicivirga sp.]